MKRIVILLCIYATTSFGQDAPTVDISPLTAPSNPALTLMGVQPSEITQPKSLNQLETSLINEFSQGSGFGLPNDFGLEVMPYWLKSRPTLKFNVEELSKNTSSPLKHLGVSLGSVNQTVGDTVQSQVGFGLRTEIFSGKMTASDLDSLNILATAVRQYQNKYGRINNALLQLQVQGSSATTYQQFSDEVKAKLTRMAESGAFKIAPELQKWDEFFKSFLNGKQPTDSLSQEEIAALIKAMVDYTDKQVNSDEVAKLAAQVTNLKATRYGFIWEVAAATFLSFPTGDVDFSQVPKVGVWSTLTYRLPSQRLDVLATVRYIEDFLIESRTSNIDFGGKLVGHFGKFSIAGEYLQRYQQRSVIRTQAEHGFDLNTTQTGFDYRTTINANYRITDSLVISYSFGKRFDFSNQSENNLVSQLSINLGFGSVPLSF